MRNREDALSSEKDVYARARSIVEHASGMPAYLADDELWYAAVDEARAELGITEKAPMCEWCGSVAPYGDARHGWISWHNSGAHRWWWKWKRRKEPKPPKGYGIPQ